jgi:hypothetical protein
VYLCAKAATPASVSAISGAEVEDGPSTALISYAGDIASDHVLVLGHNAPAIMWTLIRRGCISVTELGRRDRPDTHMADLAIVPDVATLDDAALVIQHAKRGLTSAGRIVLCTATEPSGGLAQGISSLLEQQGFSVIRRRCNDGKTIICARLADSLQREMRFGDFAARRFGTANR